MSALKAASDSRSSAWAEERSALQVGPPLMPCSWPACSACFDPRMLHVEFTPHPIPARELRNVRPSCSAPVTASSSTCSFPAAMLPSLQASLASAQQQHQEALSTASQLQEALAAALQGKGEAEQRVAAALQGTGDAEQRLAVAVQEKTSAEERLASLVRERDGLQAKVSLACMGARWLACVYALLLPPPPPTTTVCV